VSEHDDAALRDPARGMCPVCGVRWCALFATTNAASLADWQARHTRPDTHPTATPQEDHP